MSDAQSRIEYSGTAIIAMPYSELVSHSATTSSCEIKSETATIVWDAAVQATPRLIFESSSPKPEPAY